MGTEVRLWPSANYRPSPSQFWRSQVAGGVRLLPRSSAGSPTIGTLPPTAPLHPTPQLLNRIRLRRARRQPHRLQSTILHPPQRRTLDPPPVPDHDDPTPVAVFDRSVERAEPTGYRRNRLVRHNGYHLPTASGDGRHRLWPRGARFGGRVQQNAGVVIRRRKRQWPAGVLPGWASCRTNRGLVVPGRELVFRVGAAASGGRVRGRRAPRRRRSQSCTARSPTPRNSATSTTATRSRSPLPQRVAGAAFEHPDAGRHQV